MGLPVVVEGRDLQEVLQPIHDGHWVVLQFLAVDYVQLLRPGIQYSQQVLS